MKRFDYEREIYTQSLWVAEGLTSYYDDLLIARAGLMRRDEYLKRLSKQIDGLEIHPCARMAEVIAATGAELAVLAVPAAAAQGVAEALVAAGVHGILNFAPTVLRVPSKISLVSVDLAVQLEQLAFLVHLGQHEP